MDDQDISELLKKFEPRKASSRMDEEVLAASKAALHGIRIRMKRRRSYAGAVAASVLLVSFFLFQTRVPEEAASPQRREAASEAPPSREALAARARLLELKLSRVKRLAALTKVEEEYSSDLESLERILKDIGLEFLKSGPVEEDVPEPVRTSNGGKTDEESSTMLRMLVDPCTGRLRSARRPC